MERRYHSRVAVNLKAALVADQAMPLGCRVRDVSSGGMLLQYERYDKAITFHKGDTVEVRVSLKQRDERKVIPFTMTVRRVEENGISAEFLQPQSQLMRLIEPDRLDKEETREVAANEGQGGITTTSTVSPISASTSARASRRRFAVQRARAQLSETIKTAGKPVTEKKRPAFEPPPGDNSTTGKGDRRLFYIGLLSLVIAVGILLVDSGNRTHTENRMSALESAINRQANALAIPRTRLSPAYAGAKELAELNTRVESLAVSFAVLETRVTQNTDHSTMLSTTATTSTPGRLANIPPPANDKPVTETLIKSTSSTRPKNSSSGGPWVVNLVSLYDKTAANQFTEKARTRGIRAETHPVDVNGKQTWRVQVGGFSSRDEASAYGDTSKEKLGLNSVWIFKNSP
jgi:cell division septation protein DedD